MPFENLDHVLYMQIRVANLYRKAHNMTIDDFLKLDRQTDLLSFVADAYEPFHLTGDLGILEEVDDYVRGRHGTPDSLLSTLSGQYGQRGL